MRDRYAVEHTVAPKVDPQWAETFIVALRLRGVAGEQIADALAEVNDHLAECGLGADEAFGSASQYAASLNLPCGDDNTTSGIYRGIIPCVIGLVGSLTTAGAVKSWHDGVPFLVSIGTAVSAAAAIVVILALPLVIRRLAPSGPLVDRSRKGLAKTVLFGGLFYVVWIFLLLVPLIILTKTLVQIPAWLAIVIGVLLLMASTALYLNLPYRDDPVEPPISRAAGVVHPRLRGRLLLSFMFPAVTLLCSLLWLLS